MKLEDIDFREQGIKALKGYLDLLADPKTPKAIKEKIKKRLVNIVESLLDKTDNSGE